jgi:hypothetical protein
MSLLVGVELSRGPGGSLSAKPIDPRKARTCLGVAANGQHMSIIGRGRLEAGEEIWVEVLRPEEMAPEPGEAGFGAALGPVLTF